MRTAQRVNDLSYLYSSHRVSFVILIDTLWGECKSWKLSHPPLGPAPPPADPYLTASPARPRRLRLMAGTPRVVDWRARAEQGARRARGTALGGRLLTRESETLVNQTPVTILNLLLADSADACDIDNICEN